MRNYNKLLALKCYFLLLCEIFMQKTDNCVYLGVSGKHISRKLKYYENLSFSTFNNTRFMRRTRIHGTTRK